MLRGIMLFGLLLGLSAEARITNFRQYDVNSFSCSAAKKGKLNILGATWDKASDLITVMTKVLGADEPAFDEQVYGVEKVFSSAQTLMFVGRPADGSKGFIQLMLRDERPTTGAWGAKGVSYIDCEIDAVKIAN